MKKYQCPYCGEYTIKMIDKAFLDNKYKSKCKHCGKKYGPPYGYSTLLSFIIVATFLYVFISPIYVIAKILIAIFLIFINSIINILFMPIVKKE